MQFGVGGIDLESKLEMLRRFFKFTGAVIAHPKHRARLKITGRRGKDGAKRSDGRLEVSTLEFGKAQIELNPLKFGVYGDGFPIGVHRLFIFFLFGEDESETRKSGRIFGVVLHPEPPLSFRASQIALLFERCGCVRTRRLRLDRER